MAKRKARNDTFSDSSRLQLLRTISADPLPADRPGRPVQSACLPTTAASSPRMPPPLLNQGPPAPTTSSPTSSTTSATPRPTASAGYVNYRDMSVQQLGSIYERLLEQEPVRRPRTARSASAPTPTPARTAAASTPRRIWWTSSSTRPSSRWSTNGWPRSRPGPRELQSDRRPRADRKAELSRHGPGPGRARSQGAGPRHGQRPLPRQRRRLPDRLHRRPDRIRASGARLAGPATTPTTRPCWTAWPPFAPTSCNAPASPVGW